MCSCVCSVACPKHESNVVVAAGAVAAVAVVIVVWLCSTIYNIYIQYISFHLVTKLAQANEMNVYVYNVL